MTKGEERRRYIRIFLPGGQVRLISGPFLALVGKVLDISVGGIRFICESEFAAGESLNLEIALPNGMKLDCIAKIIYAEKSPQNAKQILFGAQFISLTVSQKTKLGEFIIQMRAEQDGFLKQKFV
jgi:hypothetical protein